MLANSLVELDRAHLIHPVASWRGHEAAGVRLLASAKGATVTDAEGRTLVDGFAGLWCVNAGYGHESVIAAAEHQLRVLPYATGYFGLGAEPAIRLAARLAELAPGDLDHVYFTLGGSDAVDSSVRFVRYYWNARGRPRKDQFISLEQGYHGSSTVGAGLTALPVFHAGFGLPYDWQHKIPSHYAYRNPVGSDPQEIIAASTAELRAKVEALGGPERVAAFYAEPIQGSGGVLVPPAGWTLAVRDLYEGGLIENGQAMGARLQAGLASLRDHPLVGDVRGRGMLAAVELVTDKAAKTPLPPAADPARRIFDRAWDNGLVI